MKNIQLFKQSHFSNTKLWEKLKQVGIWEKKLSAIIEVSAREHKNRSRSDDFNNKRDNDNGFLKKKKKNSWSIIVLDSTTLLLTIHNT